MTRATTTASEATCECGYVVRANADRLRCPKCKAWIVLDHSAQGRKLQLERRKARAEARAAEQRRLIGWLMFFRHSPDAGLGDTLERLIVAAGEREIGRQLLQMAKICDCKKEDRQAEWNRRYPY